MYPQALLKQSNLDHEVMYSEPDVVISFNSEIKWYFGVKGTQIGIEEYDFEWAIAHEINHGMGFESHLVRYDQYYDREAIYVAPMIATTNQSDTLVLPVSIFDSFLEAGNEKLIKFTQVISQVQVGTMKPLYFFRQFEHSEEFIAAKKLLSLSSTSAFFRFPDNDSIQLHSPPQFQTLSSLSHSHESNKKGIEFLMAAFQENSISLNQVMQANLMTKIYGPKTKKVMESLGYQTLEQKKPLNLELSTNFGM